MAGRINRAKRSYVWDHFDGDELSDLNKCRYCTYTYKYVPKAGKRNTKPTTAMRYHLTNSHKKEDPVVEEKKEMEMEKKHQAQSIVKFTCSEEDNKTRSLGDWYTILTVVNGHSFHSLTQGPFYTFAMKCIGKKPLTTHGAIRNLVMQTIDGMKDSMKEELAELYNNGERFSCTLDEWTNFRFRRFMNVHVVTNKKRFNLGLARCTGSMTAVRTLQVAKERLEQFGLKMEQMVGLTTDGAATMVCMGEKVDCIHQLCLGKFCHF